ncbi:MAG: hypothetical protein IPK80_27610 [Nannocystis sp.]|nr:hypothetical protein [Nannocystis sp.]
MTPQNDPQDLEATTPAVTDDALFALFSGPDDVHDQEVDVGLARIRERLLGIRAPVMIGGLELREVLGEGEWVRSIAPIRRGSSGRWR